MDEQVHTCLRLRPLNRGPYNRPHMPRAGSLLRTVAIVGLGAFAAHQLCFLIGLVSRGGLVDVDGRAFLGHVPTMLAVLAVALIAGRLWAAYTGASRRDEEAPSRSVLGRSLTYGVAILSVYLAQELLESALFSSHTEDLAGILADGGWFAILIAFGLGPICILLDRGIGQLEARVARVPHRGDRARGAAPATWSLITFLGAPSTLSPLALGIARRPPPPALR